MTRIAGLLIVATGALLALAAIAHPDLLAQIERLDEQIRAEPARADLLIRRGDLHRRHEEYTAAARDFEAARTLAPEDPELDFFQGRLALETGDFDTAAALLDRYLVTHPRNPTAWRLRAETAIDRGERSAPAGFERAIRLSQSPSPALYRQWVLSLLATAGRPAALAAVDEGLERFGVEVSLLGLGADAALAEHDPARTKSYLQRLPVGLQRLPPWDQRLLEARCLESESGAAAVPDCAAGATARLDRQVRTLRPHE